VNRKEGKTTFFLLYQQAESQRLRWLYPSSRYCLHKFAQRDGVFINHHLIFADCSFLAVLTTPRQQIITHVIIFLFFTTILNKLDVLHSPL
jgi:hypothetical protein